MKEMEDKEEMEEKEENNRWNEKILEKWIMNIRLSYCWFLTKLKVFPMNIIKLESWRFGVAMATTPAPVATATQSHRPITLIRLSASKQHLSGPSSIGLRIKVSRRASADSLPWIRIKGSGSQDQDLRIRIDILHWLAIPGYPAGCTGGRQFAVWINHPPNPGVDPLALIRAFGGLRIARVIELPMRRLQKKNPSLDSFQRPDSGFLSFTD